MNGFPFGSINRTSVELKQDGSTGKTGRPEAINRTSVELKHLRQSHRDGRKVLSIVPVWN